MTEVTISKKGQITIPAEIRKKLSLGPKRKLEVLVSEDGIVLKPVRSIMDLCGICHDRAALVTDDWDTVREMTEKVVAEQVAREGMD